MGMTKEEAKRHMEFLYNPDNSHKCSKCAENCGANAHNAFGLPCGQQNCWVDICCRNREEEC